jgi:hypothetical protein
MKIFELRQPKIIKPIFTATSEYFKNKSLDADGKILSLKLSKLGWTYNNKGCFSSVYTNPNKRFVLKINNRPDRGYARYIEILKDNPNIHFPNIGDMKVVEFGGFNYYVYLIEKLKNLPLTINYEGVKIDTDILTDCLQRIATGWSRDYKWFTRYFDDKTMFYLEEQPELVKAAQIIGKNQEDRFLDMHSGNFMIRNDGTIVITDPYS